MSHKVKHDPAMAAEVDEVLHAADRAASLTRQLLAFSRKQILQPVPLDLNEIVGGVARMARRLIGTDVQLRLEPGTAISQVLADPAQVEQVLLNLIVNARDAMPSGGTITVRTRNVQLGADAPEITQAGIAPGSFVLLEVADTGIGMDQATQARIFEPFFTTKGPGKGTGLGLATVFGIVKQSDGYIEVFSEVDVGTSFKILFPAVNEKAAPLSHHDTPVRQGRETVLLVEDEEQVRKIAKLTLETHRYKVLEASNGQEATTVAEAHRGPIHLVITDVVMPEMSGRQLAEHLRQHQQGLKVLFMSGYTDDAVVRHGVSEATDAFLQKPFSPLELARKVREVLDGKK
jgi:CheY-like chemotaxis protein